MIISVDVYSMAGVKQGEGPLYAMSASVTEELDGAGTVRLELPLADERVGALFSVERIVYIYVDGTLLGAGIINQTRVRRGSSGFTLTGQGPDLLNLLQRKSVLRGRVFEATAVSSVISTLAGLASWTASTSETDTVSVRLDGQSVLKALLAVAESRGWHLRAGASANTVEVGTFGADSGLYIYEAVTPQAETNPDLLLLEEIRVTTESKDVVNWIEPIGGNGAGEGEQTLKEAYDAGTRTSPYTIQTTTGPNGATVYYLADASSISTYGQVEKVIPFSQISPLSNAATDAQRGSEALYDLAAAWLQRHKEPLTTLEVSVRAAEGVDESLIRVGSKVRISYKGVVETGNASTPVYTWLDVDGDYWIMGVSKSATLEGVRYSLKVSSVDRREMGTEEILLGALEAVQVRGVQVAQYLNHYNYTYEEEVAPTYDAVIPLDVTDVTRSISRVILRLTSRPFRTTATGTASGGSSSETSTAGGDHRHRMFVYSTGAGSFTNYQFTGRDSSDGLVPVNIESLYTVDLYTYDSSGDHSHSVTIPAHTHAISYGIADDTVYPAGVQVWVNGVDRTSALGGPWGSTAAAIDEELDITAYITGAGTLRQRHTITIKCTSGQGIVQGNVDVQETITSIQA